jgi:NADH-quinone oxidoreductase subunit C
LVNQTPEISQKLEKRLGEIASKFPAAGVSRDRMVDYVCINTNPDDLHNVMKAIASWDDIPMNYLRCITAVDQLTHIEVVYFLTNIPNGDRLAVATSCPRNEGTIPSVVDIWETASFQEREVYEFFGVNFEGHPDLRRLLTPEQYTGFPLLKDYPKGGDPDDLIAVDAYLPDGWIEKQKNEKDQLTRWLKDEIAKRQGKSDSAGKAESKK